ncbi:MAG: beta-N-acetylhexosaminidase [Acidimicrobiales bacterium]|nr:beta-N-acetylhexosaminidase [Acidimicrobiales bacterium]
MTEPVRLGSFAKLVPLPRSVEPRAALFTLVPETVVVVRSEARQDAADAVDLLRSRIGAASGLALPVRDEAGTAPAISFTAGPERWAPEHYTISVTQAGVDVVAADHDGFVWAVQTLVQALPPEALSSTRQPGTFALPAVVIDDAPRYRWRAAMLDLARHFFGPDDVKAFVDEVSAYKLNRLHLHLTDDQGWRIEIRSHPELTTKGSTSEVGGDKGGYLTQADYRGIVDYARERGVTIVPEVDTPGHTNAALHSIPALNCDGDAPPVYTGMKVGFSSLCIDKDDTYEWFDDVVGELADMTPGKWIHLGGDESHSTPAADYRTFVAKAARIVVDHGKTPIGWEEIGNADLPTGAVAQHWRDPEPTLAAVRHGADVILSPSSKVYFDMKYVEGGPGNVWAGLIPTRTAYDWNPATLLDGLDADRVLGVEAPVWTELITDRKTFQERTLPRLPALAEVAWSEQKARSWDGFRQRIGTHAPRWEAAGWAWTRDPGIDWSN